VSNICLTNGSLISTKTFDDRSRPTGRASINSWRTQRFVSTPIDCEAKWSNDGYSTRRSNGRPSRRGIAPGPRRNPDETINMLLFLLDRRDVVAAINRLRAGHGLRVVKRKEPAGHPEPNTQVPSFPIRISA